MNLCQGGGHNNKCESIAGYTNIHSGWRLCERHYLSLSNEFQKHYRSIDAKKCCYTACKNTAEYFNADESFYVCVGHSTALDREQMKQRRSVNTKMCYSPNCSSVAKYFHTKEMTDYCDAHFNAMDSYHRNLCKPLGQDDSVNHPSHYNQSDKICTCGKQIECIDVVRHMSFNLGNAIKYIWRCDDKGKRVEDLKKAIWYLQDEVKKHEKV